MNSTRALLYTYCNPPPGAVASLPPEPESVLYLYQHPHSGRTMEYPLTQLGMHGRLPLSRGTHTPSSAPPLPLPASRGIDRAAAAVAAVATHWSERAKLLRPPV